MLNDLLIVICIFTLQGLAGRAAMLLTGHDPNKLIKSEVYYLYASNEIDRLVNFTDHYVKVWVKGIWIGYKAYLKFTPVVATVASLGVVLLTWIITPVEFEIMRVIIMCQIVFGSIQTLLSLVVQSTPKTVNH